MSTIIFEQTNGIARIKLNRPDVRNAFNAELIQELSDTFKKVEKDAASRVVILSGEGGFFCAGADLNWMKSFVGASREENEADARKLGDLLYYLNNFPKPLIVVAHGAAVGGGVGLVAVADIALAAEETVYSLAEVKLGLIPAVISPFVIAKMGEAGARRYFLTGEKFGNDEAMRFGLIHEQLESDQLQARAGELAKSLLSSGPEALKAAKELISKVGSSINQEVREYTVKKISELRVSAEAQEGIAAFLEKRKANWIPQK
ncbi:MAG: enoyl-CoA hydratase/isomerase family protein [Deltaproteobacteria bacterium]|nr:MAG: enoyl-CoA hydratase/isomerase family protein [Deltaproteobacteria bacterium]